MLISVLEITAITMGLILATWGLFHQLIVGGAILMFDELTDSEARLFIMTWVAQGAFMSFSGLLIATTVFFHGLLNEVVLTVCSLTGFALLLLGLHVLVSGYKTHLRPIQIGAVLEILTSLVLLFATTMQLFA